MCLKGVHPILKLCVLEKKGGTQLLTILVLSSDSLSQQTSFLLRGWDLLAKYMCMNIQTRGATPCSPKHCLHKTLLGQWFCDERKL